MADEEYFGRLVPPNENVLHIGNGAEPRSLDPHKTAGVPEAKIFNNVFEGLTAYNPKTLAPEPGIATRWESQDRARVWIFHLRREAKFSDGRPITAADFVWSWRRIVAPDTASPYANLMYYVKNAQAISEGKLPPEKLGVSALDDHTLRVEMAEPTAFFVKMTPHYAFTVVPRQAIERYGADWTKPEHTVSSGAFRVVEYSPYNQVVLEPNPYYWDRKRIRLDRIYVLPIQELSQMANLYRAGEIDTMISNQLPPTLIRELRQRKDYQSGPQFTTYYYDLNTRRKPFNDVRVRRAFNLAVDKAAVAYKFLGRGELPATTFIPPGLPGYTAPPGPKYDPQKARRLLAEAGYPNGRGFPTVTIYYNTQEAHQTVAQAVQRMWKEQLNINVELQNEEWQTFQARRERRDYDIARDAWIGDYLDGSTYLDLFAEDTLNNHPGWVDRKYADLMTRANAEADDTKRAILLKEAEAYLIDQAPIVPVYFYALSYLKKPWVEGWYPNLTDEHPFKYVWIHRDWRKLSPIARTP